MSYTQEALDQHLELMGDPSTEEIAWLQSIISIKKARVYVKNPADAPLGARLQEGAHGGHYYETEVRQPAQQEAPKEKRSLDALNPRIYDNYDKLLHFETGKEVLVPYMHNTEKAPDMGGRFGQDIEPQGKYVILDEMGMNETVVPPGWKKSAQILYNPLVLDWKDWKQRLSSFYGNLTGKNLSDALKAEGFDGIVTIDGQNVSEIVLLKPRIESYEELKATPYYKGSTEIQNDITKLSDKYDVFDVNAARILVSVNDLPTDIGNKVLECADSFKFSSLKSDKPVIKFLGKTYIKEFNWQDRDGKEHTSSYGGTANYVSNEIHIYDDYEMEGILHHEVGHFVYKRIMSSVDAIPDPSIKSIVDIDSVDDYRKMVEILKNHNVLISSENIEKILDDINYVRELGLMEDMHTNNLTYYDKGYGALYGILHRLKENRALDITPFEEKQWKKYRTLMKQELKSNNLRNEWYDIWKTEGYSIKEYANRNNSETFAEFYQTVDRILRYSEDSKRVKLIQLAANHPLKWAFFKKHVVGKWLK